ncbi:beta-glucuronidase [Clostridium sp. chh4-2]|uniref:beta-glucuronidase n=1 Tax=Clostridium sp. chh4-2 TaxID=2067550 RepID=UPI000CCE5A22|nr:beta-glucuronidase [Clostridium sp. chh4-2]PNV61117.1 beta-glucuronidase [Clostridium sp. chh4-2]
MLKYSMLYPRQTVSRSVLSLDGMWKFCLDPKGEGKEKGWTEGIPGKERIPVPASFQDFYTDKTIREYAGDMWYETEVFIPEEYKGKMVGIRFGCATHKAEVFVNGIHVASHIGGFLPFTADITEAARYREMNRVVVLVNNELSETNIPCGQTVTLKNGVKMNKPYFDFYNYSGLQRPVKLTAYPKEYIFDFTVNHKLVGSDAEVSYKTVTTGTNDVTVTVYDEEGNEAASASGKDGILNIRNVRLWQVRDAYLYTFVVRIRNEEGIVDEYREEIGIRTVEVRGRDILINGKPVYLKGFGKHEDSDIVGRGFNIGVMKRDFECMKWIGANSFRTSHYPYSDEIYEMADREGFLIIDEVPAVGLFESLMNFMEASTGKKTAFFQKDTTPLLLENHLKAVEEMIARDKNHACVIAWSLLNEPETTDASAVPYFEKVFAAAHELDVQKRPRTFAMIMNSLPDTCKCYQFADMIALNRYYGWYQMGGYEISDAEEAFRREMDQWQAKNLNKPFIFTEYGADTYVAEHKLPSVMWSQEYQTEYLEMCHRVFDSYEFVRGEQVWNFADFQTTEGIMRVNGNKKGIFTRQRQPKEAAFFYKKRWESLPLNYKSGC